MNKYGIRAAAALCTGALVLGGLSGCGNSQLQELLYGKPQEELLLKESISSEPTETEPEETEENGEENGEEATEETEPEETTEPQKVLEGEVAANNLNIRQEPGTNSKIVGSLKRGDRVTVTERKKVDTMFWGKIDEGWISMLYVAIDGEVEGNWYQQLEKDGEDYHYRIWEFFPDGEFQYTDYLFLEEDEYDTADEENSGSGTYTLEEEKLTLRFTKGEKVLICGEEQRVPGTRELSVVIEGGTVKLEDTETWSWGNLESVQEKLQNALAQKKAEESKWILGTWRDIEADEEAGTVRLTDTWVFKKDGTFEYSFENTLYNYSEEDGLVKDEANGNCADSFKGTYEVDGNQVILDYTYDPMGEDEPEKVHETISAELKKGNLILEDDHGSVVYTKETLEEVVERVFSA